MTIEDSNIDVRDGEETQLDTTRISTVYFVNRDGYNLTQSAMDGVMTGVTIFHQRTMELMHSKVSKVLCDNNVPEEVISATNAIFENSPFVNLQTKYKQNQYFKNIINCKLLQNVYIELYKHVGTFRTCVGKELSSIYISCFTHDL